MAMPNNILSPLPAYSAFLEPDDRTRTTLLQDWELGGVAIGDPSQGLQVQVWEARLSGNTIQTKPEAGSTWTDITSDTDITEIALSFDQNMRPSVSYVAGGAAKLYWYDPTVASYVTVTYAGATSPVVTMDDKRATQTGLNDILLFYLRSGRVYHRRLRDRYTIEYDLAAVPTGMTRIVRWGMTTGKRIQLEFGTGVSTVPPPDPDDIGDLYQDLRTDTLYKVVDGEIRPMFGGAGALTSVWRSRKFTLPTRPGAAWLRINGPQAGPATVRVYGDGVLRSTQTLAARAPVRFPAKRARLWEIEVEGAARVTSVVVASSVEELRGE